MIKRFHSGVNLNVKSFCKKVPRIDKKKKVQEIESMDYTKLNLDNFMEDTMDGGNQLQIIFSNFQDIREPFTPQYPLFDKAEKVEVVINMNVDDFSQLPNLFEDQIVSELEPIEIDVKTNQFVIQDSMNWQKLWSILVFGLMILLMVQMPFQFSELELDQNIVIVQFDLFIDLMFLTDMCINFFVSYEEKNGKVVDDREQIIFNYLSGWFLIDFVSSVPISYIIHITGISLDGQRAGLTDLLKIPKFWRMVKLTKLFRLIKAIKQHNKLLIMIQKIKFSATLQKVVLQALILMEVCHVFSCIQISIANESNDNWWTTWVQMQPNFDISSKLDKQLVAWYFVVQTVTTVGQGDVPTVNLPETWFKMVLIIFGVQTFNFVIASITQLQLENAIDNIKDRDLKEKIDLINLKQKLSGQAMTSMEMLQQQTSTKELDEDYKIIFSLPEINAMEVMEDVQFFFRDKIDIFSNKSLRFVKRIFQELKMKQFFENEQVYQRGQHAKNFQFLAYGKLTLNEDLLSKCKFSNQGIFRVIESSQSFGFDEVFLNEFYQNSCLTHEQSEIYIISASIQYDTSIQFNWHQEIQETLQQANQLRIETKVAIIFIFHKFYKKNQQIFMSTFQELQKEFKIDTFFSFIIESKCNKYEQMIRKLDELVQSIQNIRCREEKNEFTGKWFTKFLGESQTKLLNDVTYKYLQEDQKLRFFEKILVHRKKLQIDDKTVNISEIIDHKDLQFEDVQPYAVEEKSKDFKSKAASQYVKNISISMDEENDSNFDANPEVIESLLVNQKKYFNKQQQFDKIDYSNVKAQDFKDDENGMEINLNENVNFKSSTMNSNNSKRNSQSRRISELSNMNNKNIKNSINKESKKEIEDIKKQMSILQSQVNNMKLTTHNK